jgi:hypothetical protein
VPLDAERQARPAELRSMITQFRYPYRPLRMPPSFITQRNDGIDRGWFATLVHAISKTNPTAPNKIHGLVGAPVRWLGAAGAPR